MDVYPIGNGFTLYNMVLGIADYLSLVDLEFVAYDPDLADYYVEPRIRLLVSPSELEHFGSFTEIRDYICKENEVLGFVSLVRRE